MDVQKLVRSLTSLTFNSSPIWEVIPNNNRPYTWWACHKHWLRASPLALHFQQDYHPKSLQRTGSIYTRALVNHLIQANSRRKKKCYSKGRGVIKCVQTNSYPKLRLICGKKHFHHSPVFKNSTCISATLTRSHLSPPPPTYTTFFLVIRPFTGWIVSPQREMVKS